MALDLIATALVETGKYPLFFPEGYIKLFSLNRITLMMYWEGHDLKLHLAKGSMHALF